MTINIKISHLIIGILLLGSLLGAGAALAGDPDSSGAPTDAASESYSLEDLYRRLTAGTAGSQSTFIEPSSAPGAGTMHSINDIMAVAPALDNTNGATSTQVLAGQTFWGLTASQWATQTGTMPDNGAMTITPGTLTQTITAGYHNGSGYVEGDGDLLAGNIAQGVNLFGVDGSGILASGDATPGQVLNGITFSNSSGASTGTMPNNGAVNITPGTTAQTIALGYHNGSGYVEGASDLVAGNIAQGVNLFGVDGSGILASGDATPGQVLNGITFSNSSGAGMGTMPDREGDNASTAQSQSGGMNYFTAPEGYYDGDDRVSATDALVAALDADITAGNIRSGVDIFGQEGTLAPGGDAIAADLFNGKTAHLASDWTLDTGTLDLACNTDTFNGTSNRVADAYDGGGNGTNRWCMTDSGDATAADIAAGKIAWVDGFQLTGTATGTGARFTDNGDGTVTDNHNGLIWLKDAGCIPTPNWASGSTQVDSLNSGTDFSCDDYVPGTFNDWRFSEIWELYTLMDPREINPALPDGHPFANVQSYYYWSHTPYPSTAVGYAWFMYMGPNAGYVGYGNRNYDGYVWPVRGGQ